MGRKKKVRRDYTTRAIPPCRTLVASVGLQTGPLPCLLFKKGEWLSRIALIHSLSLFLYRDLEGTSEDRESLSLPLYQAKLKIDPSNRRLSIQNISLRPASLPTPAEGEWDDFLHACLTATLTSSPHCYVPRWLRQDEEPSHVTRL